jgi:steroid delta-isomerase-like uncharacterized protein
MNTSTPAVMPTTATSPDARIALQRRTVAEHVRAENDKDWSAVHDTFVNSEETFWDAVPLCTTFRGPAGVADIYAAFDTALPDFSVEVTGEYHTPGASILEVTIRGTHRGEYCGIPASGNRVQFEAMALFLFGDGAASAELVGERVYFDNETVLRQMRGEPHAATGVGLAERDS